MAIELTDNLIKALAAPEKGNRITYDTKMRGLGVRVTSAGARAFIFNYRTKGTGTERRYTIGDATNPTKKTIDAARKRAEALRHVVDGGGDPVAELHAIRGAPTVADLADRFAAEHMPRLRASTQDEYQRLLRVHIRPGLGNKRVADLRHSDIDTLHRKIAADAPYAANRAVAVMSRMLSLAIKWEMRGDNPARGIERAPEQKRQRFLSPAEIVRLSEALAAHPERTSANAVRLLLLTGARKGETLVARWSDIDITAGTWSKPSATTKTAKLHRIPLSAPALQLLSGMKAEADRENDRRIRDRQAPIEYVFPGTGGNSLGNVKHFWAAVCRKAGLSIRVEKTDDNGRIILDAKGAPIMVWQSTVRIHDLRHTYASILVSSGLSLPIIGALLGHTQISTTNRYAHLMDDPLRAATERAGAIITAAAKDGGEVVPIAGRRA